MGLMERTNVSIMTAFEKNLPQKGGDEGGAEAFPVDKQLSGQKVPLKPDPSYQ